MLIPSLLLVPSQPEPLTNFFSREKGWAGMCGASLGDAKNLEIKKLVQRTQRGCLFRVLCAHT